MIHSVNSIEPKDSDKRAVRAHSYACTLQTHTWVACASMCLSWAHFFSTIMEHVIMISIDEKAWNHVFFVLHILLYPFSPALRYDIELILLLSALVLFSIQINFISFIIFSYELDKNHENWMVIAMIFVCLSFMFATKFE